LYILILLLVIPFVSAQTEDYNNNSYLITNFQLLSDFNVEDSGSYINNLNVIVTAFPKTQENQEVLSFDVITTPQGKYRIEDDQIYVTWENPQGTNFNVLVNANVRTSNSIVPVLSKVFFPLKNDYIDYIEPTEYIDVTPAIRAEAQALVKNTNDLYQVAYNIGIWVKENIRYDLSTINADVVQKASWVYENREGVCDELTNLFVSMMRSVGVPTRFVYGMAYTNTEHDWVSHAWAEVYFEGSGWVPFDVTYGQLGWIDPSHVKLSISDDSTDPTVIYSWEAKNKKDHTKTLEVTTTLEEAGPQIEEPATLEIRPLVNKLGEDSYIPVEVRIKNKKDYYLPEWAIVTKAPTLLTTNIEYGLLKPNEMKQFYWIVKGPSDLEAGYIYTIPVEIKDLYRTVKEVNLTFSSGYKSYTEAEANALIQYIEDQKGTKKFVELDCGAKDHYFLYENITIDCVVTNLEGKKLTDIAICAETSCETLTLNANKEDTVTLKLKPTAKGVTQITVDATYIGEKVEDTITTYILTDPDLKVLNLEIPNKIPYDQESNLTFIMMVQAPVTDVTVYIGGKKTLYLDVLETSKKAKIMFKGKDFLKQDNQKLTITFKDQNGIEYTQEQEFVIEVTGTPWYIWLLSIFGLS